MGWGWLGSIRGHSWAFCDLLAPLLLGDFGLSRRTTWVSTRKPTEECGVPCLLKDSPHLW